MKWISIFFCLLVPLVGVMADADNIENTRDNNIKLRSDDYLEATQAMKALYEGGVDSIPFLLANFNDKTKFIGLCGSKILESQSERVTRIRKIDKDHNVITIQEVSLYLLIGIMKNSLYFEKGCNIRIDSEHDEVDLVFGEIRNLYDNYLQGYTEFKLEDVEHILKNHNVWFK